MYIFSQVKESLGYQTIGIENGQIIGGVEAKDVACCCNECRCVCTDFMFLVDTTGSMGGAISTIKNNIAKVLSGGVYLLPDGSEVYVPPFDSPSCFWSLATFRDFEDEGYENGWIVNQGFTQVSQNIVAAAQTMNPGGGGDFREQNLAALTNAAGQWMGIGGRGQYQGCAATYGSPAIKKVIICASDVPGHENGAKGKPYPTIQQTIHALQQQGIRMICWNIGGGWGGQGGTIATATGGFTVPGSGPLALLNALCRATTGEDFVNTGSTFTTI